MIYSQLPKWPPPPIQNDFGPGPEVQIDPGAIGIQNVLPGPRPPQFLGPPVGGPPMAGKPPPQFLGPPVGGPPMTNSGMPGIRTPVPRAMFGGNSLHFQRGTDSVPAMLTPHEGVLNTGAMALPGVRNFVRRANTAGLRRMPPLPASMGTPMVARYQRGTADAEGPVWDPGGFVSNPMPTPIPGTGGFPSPTPTPSPTPSPTPGPQPIDPAVEVPTDPFGGAGVGGEGQLDPTDPFAGARAGGGLRGGGQLGSGSGVIVSAHGGVPLGSSPGMFRGGTWIARGLPTGYGYGGMGYSMVGVPGTFVTTPSGQTYSTAVGMSMHPNDARPGGGFLHPTAAVSESSGTSLDLKLAHAAARAGMTVEDFLAAQPVAAEQSGPQQYPTAFTFIKSAMARYGDHKGIWQPTAFTTDPTLAKPMPTLTPSGRPIGPAWGMRFGKPRAR